MVKVLPWTLVGLLQALWSGNMLNYSQFNTLIAVLVFFNIGLMIWQDKHKGELFIL
jgi:hypothetical protein